MAPIKPDWNRKRLRSKNSSLKSIPIPPKTNSNAAVNKIFQFPLPNVEYAQKVSLSRKLLQFNFAFSTGSYKSNYAQYPWTVWYDKLERMNQRQIYSQLEDRKHCLLKKRHRTNSNIMKRNLMAYGISEDNAIAAAAYIKTAPTPDIERFLTRSTEHNQSTKLAVWPCIYSKDVPNILITEDIYLWEPSSPASSTSTQASTSSSTTMMASSSAREHHHHKLSKQIPEVDENAQYGIESAAIIEHAEEWQMANWIKLLQMEYWKPEINEIWYNRSLYRKTINSSRPQKRVNTQDPEYVVQLLRRAFFKQEWTDVIKLLVGVTNGALSNSGAEGHRSWILWNVGFYSILRFEKTLDLTSVAVKMFARSFDNLYHPPCYTRRLGVEVAIWLTQEGRFLEGVKFMEEMDNFGQNCETNQPLFDMLEVNPKCDLVDFVYNLILAVHSYALYRRDKSLYKSGLFNGNKSDLNHAAEVALSRFEGLLEFTDKCEAEITTYLQQLVELKVKCHSPEETKELLDEIVISYYGNAFVERVYLKFLSKYFKHQKSSISRKLVLRRKFRFTSNPPHWHHQGRAISAYRQRKVEAHGVIKSFNRLPNPLF